MISRLTLDHFRNHIHSTLPFDKGVTVIVGDNATGKTNIMEALYLLSTGDSFRASRLEEMVAWGVEAGHVTGVIENGDTDELQVTVTRGTIQGKRVQKRLFRVNGTGKRKLDYVGRLPSVLFRPEELRLITGSPAERRRFFDEVLVQTSKDYARSLASYEKALSRRNRLLDLIREGSTSRTALMFWDQLLIKEGEVLTRAREGLIESINKIPSVSGKLRLNYERSVISPERLHTYATQELQAGYTLVGPHKDDFVLFDDTNEAHGRDLMVYGSRGEQRMAVLWLKEAQLEYIATQLTCRPLLLLDDISSELDREHDMQVVDLCRRQQTVLTTTDAALGSLLTGMGRTIHLPLQ